MAGKFNYTHNYVQINGEGRSAAPGPQILVTMAAANDIVVIARSALPADAIRALGQIESNESRPNARKPQSFNNDGRNGSQILPTHDEKGNPVTYTEHTINPREPGQSLDSKRFVVGSDGKTYYTDDHYKTFKQVEPPPQ